MKIYTIVWQMESGKIVHTPIHTSSAKLPSKRMAKETLLENFPWLNRKPYGTYIKKIIRVHWR